MDPFASPCDLWVLPPPRASAWFAHVDWYLNWQLSKGLAYSGLNLPHEVGRMAEILEVEVPTIQISEQPNLLVLSQGRIPSKKCVVIDDTKNFDRDWVRQVVEVAKELDAKRVHVFLPAKLSVNEAKKAVSFDGEILFSADEEANPA